MKIINYRTGQKGTLLANWLAFGHSIKNDSTGASVMIQGTERLKWWFYHGVYDRLAELGYETPGGKAPPTITWEQQRQWFLDDDIAEIAFYGMLETLQSVTAPVVSMQHLPMLRRHHIDELKRLGHEIWGITTAPSQVKQIEIENHFKTADRDYITPQHRQLMQDYLASKGIPCPDGRPEKEIDSYCVERDLSPTDENRILVMRKLIAMSNRPNRADGHTLIICNQLYNDLDIPTVPYEGLFYPPYGAVLDLSATADLDSWDREARASWVPPTVEMFGIVWDLAACGYDPNIR